MFNKPIEENSTIIVIDSIMGSGKTSYAIQLMSETPEVQKFIYITPFLTEVERIKQHVNNRVFIEPTNKNKMGTKIYSFKKLLQDGKDIVSTHSLFYNCDEEILELLEAQNYTLILDECMNVIEKINIVKKDLEILIEGNFISIDDTGWVNWIEDKDYNGKFKDIKEKCFNGNLCKYGNDLFMWCFPVNIFKSFRKVYILTYLFDGQIQKYYYDLFNVKYEYKSVIKANNKYELVDYFKEDRQNLKSLINIYEGNLNDIGKEKYSLSSTKLEGLKNKEHLAKFIQNNIYNWFRNIVKGKAHLNMWTTIKAAKPKLKGNGYTKGFIACNCRSTNEFKDKTNLAYVLNRFINPIEKNFFNTHGIELDEDLYALSELLQWIFRSAVRDNKPINIYIPSSRMRGLLIRWLDGEL